MSNFKTLRGDATPLDPYKRTRYTEGLEPGADELRQDQLHHRESRRLHQRALHGYGVVCGLDVWTSGGEVVVEPGLAVSPRGQVIRVPAARCVKLDEWLDAYRGDVSPPASPPEELELFVVLCYRECPVDPVIVPSGPCRTVDDPGVASRLADGFELELRTVAPAQDEEDAVRELGGLFRRLEIVEGPGGLDRESFEDEVRALSPFASPPGASPPGTLRIHPDDVAELLGLALRIWSREIRPQVAGNGCVQEPEEDCVLLARLLVPPETASPTDGDVEVDEVAPPILLSTRLLQEWLLHLGAAAARPGVHAELEGLGADDHPHYLLADGSRPLTSDWGAGAFRIREVAAAADPGDVLVHGQGAAGDLAGTYPDPDVAALRGTLLADPLEPVEDQALVWSGGRWVPGNVVASLEGEAGGDLAGTYPDPTVVGLQRHSVSDDDPDDGSVLAWNRENDQWQPTAPCCDRGLTRIVGLSWEHGTRWEGEDLESFQESVLAEVSLLEGETEHALVVAFGRQTVNDGGGVTFESLDANLFRVLLESPERSAVRSLVQLEVLKMIPVEVSDADPRITKASELKVPEDSEPEGSEPEGSVTAVAVFIDGEEVLRNPNTEKVLRIELKGDFLYDKDGRAVDARFLRGELPTGGTSQFGVQGGTFESWIVIGEPR